MAFANSNQAFPGSPDRAIFFDGLDEIGAASRLESTIGPQQRTDANLVKPHHENEAATGKCDDAAPNAIHVSLFSCGHLAITEHGIACARADWQVHGLSV